MSDRLAELIKSEEELKHIKEQRSKKAKEYYQAHKDAIAEKYKANKDKRKAYYEKNKDKILNAQKERYYHNKMTAIGLVLTEATSQ